MSSYEITVRDETGYPIYQGSRMTTSYTTIFVRDMLTSAPATRRPGTTITVTVR